MVTAALVTVAVWVAIALLTIGWAAVEEIVSRRKSKARRRCPRCQDTWDARIQTGCKRCIGVHV